MELGSFKTEYFIRENIITNEYWERELKLY